MIEITRHIHLFDLSIEHCFRISNGIENEYWTLNTKSNRHNAKTKFKMKMAHNSYRFIILYIISVKEKPQL